MSAQNPEHSTGSAAVSSSVAADDLQENLRRLDRLANLGLVSANVAHEIKNGLVAINTVVEVLLEKGGDPEMAGLVRRELKRIDQLVTQMLRISSPKPTPKTALNIHQLLDHSLRLLEHQMKGRLIALKREYRAQPDQLHADELQLQQALMNVLLNAMEAIGSEGALTVLTETRPDERGGQCLQIHIHDTGSGIDPENLPRLFTPFFTTKKHGTGLGLTICERIVREHDGTIKVRSEKGAGTTFTISLAMS